MGTITNITATAANQSAKVAAGTQTQAEKDTATNAFELLMRNMSARFKGGTASPLDANIVRDPANRPEPKQAEPRDDRRVEKNDKADTKADKADDRKDAADAKDDAADADAANDQAADAGDAQEATQTVQMAALQAQLMSTTTITPVAVVAQAVTEGPVVQAQLADDTQIVLADPTAQVQAVATVAATQQAAAAPVVAQQIAQATTDDASDTPVVAQTEEVVDTSAQTVVADKVVKAQGPVQTAAAQTEVVEDDTPKAEKHAEVKAQATPAAKAQSESLSRLLGNQDQIKVAVTVEAPKAATPSINPYNHFTGYSMAANAGETLANGGHNQADATNALVADDKTAAQPQAAAVAVAPTAALNAPAPVAATADTGVSAISSTSASQGSANTQGEAGQGAFGQSNLNNANGTNEANGTKNTEGAKQPTPSQVFEQIKVHITRATKAGLDHVSIQLRPDDLGRIEVKLEMAHDGKVKAMVIADNPQTLQLMQQDSHGLERALNDAGLRTDANTLEFSLRGDSNTGLAKSEGGNAAGGNGGTEADAAAEADSFDYGRAAYLRGGVDTYA